MEIMLAKSFGWGLHEMDETEIESLFEFVFYYFRRQGQNGTKQSEHGQAYADEVAWM